VRLTAAVGPGILIAGLVTLVLAASRGEASIYLVVVVPVMTGRSPLAFLAVLLVFIGFFVTFLGWPASAALLPGEDSSVPGPPSAPTPPARRWGGVVFLGPLPLIFGSDPRMTRSMILVGAVLFLALLALTILALLA